MDIVKSLFEMQDNAYREFSAKLIPNVDKKRIIGVRTQDLRTLTKRIDKERANEFISQLPHEYLEEDSIHANLICLEKDYDSAIEKLEKFLPFVDNWATCDGLRPKVFIKNKDRLIKDVERWIKSPHEWTVRFAIEMLMTHFLEEDFNSEHLKMVAEVSREEYYVNMMIAWYFATALAKQYDSAIIYLQEGKLPVWAHNKTIQKAVESYRISLDKKVYLKSLRIK